MKKRNVIFFHLKNRKKATSHEFKVHNTSLMIIQANEMKTARETDTHTVDNICTPSQHMALSGIANNLHLSCAERKMQQLQFTLHLCSFGSG